MIKRKLYLPVGVKELGFVTAFEIPEEYFQTFKVEIVGAAIHEELWVPAEQLEEFNSKIMGNIMVEAAFYGKEFKGEKKE